MATKQQVDEIVKGFIANPSLQPLSDDLIRRAATALADMSRTCQACGEFKSKQVMAVMALQDKKTKQIIGFFRLCSECLEKVNNGEIRI